MRFFVVARSASGDIGKLPSGRLLTHRPGSTGERIGSPLNLASRWLGSVSAVFLRGCFCLSSPLRGEDLPRTREPGRLPVKIKK